MQIVKCDMCGKLLDDKTSTEYWGSARIKIQSRDTQGNSAGDEFDTCSECTKKLRNEILDKASPPVEVPF